MECPICKKTVPAADDRVAPNRYFPFCSDRCRLIDLGRWLGGKYSIPVQDPPGGKSDSGEFKP